MQRSISNFSFVLVIFGLATVAKASKYLAERPGFLTPCALDDANFNKCLASNLQGLLVQWKDGVPGAKIVGPLDPLLVKRVKFTQDSNNRLAINADLQNVYVKGASQLTIKEANYNSKQYVAKGLVYIPKLSFEFDYKVKGHVLALNLNGHGKGKFEAEKLSLILELGVKPRSTPEAIFAEVQRAKVIFREIGNFKIKLDNLFGGNTDLEQTAHTLFNENWRQFYEILRPAAEQAIEAILLDRTKKILDYVPATYFIQNFQ